MKKITTHIFIAVLVMNVPVLHSCKKNFLNEVPDNLLTLDEVFKRRTETEKYLANVYSFIRDEANQWNDGGNPWLGLSDEADVTWNRSNYPTFAMNLGAWNASSNYYNFWTHYYRGIRNATTFFHRVEECQELYTYYINGDSVVKQYKAEARFLRAFFYFNLIRQYGPVVLLPTNETIAPDAHPSSTQYARSTMDDCVDFIAKELDTAAMQLPAVIPNVQWYGVPTRGAALAVKARLLLYAASPLYNGNTDMAGLKNQDGTQLISQSFDKEKWKKAADAAKAVIDLNLYSIYKKNNDAFKDYQGIFTDNWNSEVIFARPAIDYGAWTAHCSPRQLGGSSWNGIGVTQQLVDAYHMANGLPINDPASGYIETGFSAAATPYTPAGTWNMYVGREPRFYVSVTFNGSSWFTNGCSNTSKVEMYYNGRSGKRTNTDDYSRTGYLVRKGIHPSSRSCNSAWTRTIGIFFRLGEIYLNYAESLNEYEPGNSDILNYVNEIRSRAGIPGLPAGLSQSDMRDRIRHERRVELAFESHRYFDTRRWKMAEQTDAGDFYGMNIDGGTGGFTDSTFYTRTVFEKRVFQKKHYVFPIPQSELNRDSKLVQNPDWF
jgi:starch-binding outer membrane protein, SusD/RagB family